MKIFITVLFTSFLVTSAQAALTKTVRDQNGKIINMGPSEAMEYCESLQLTVPNVREIAEWAVLNGATGIRETNFPNVEPHTDVNFDNELEVNRSEGYRAVWKNKDQMGSGGVYFYYNEKGFNPVSNETGWFYRSSSKIWLGTPSYYVLDSITGNLTWEDSVLNPIARVATKCSDQ